VLLWYARYTHFEIRCTVPVCQDDKDVEGLRNTLLLARWLILWGSSRLRNVVVTGIEHVLRAWMNDQHVRERRRFFQYFLFHSHHFLSEHPNGGTRNCDYLFCPALARDSYCTICKWNHPDF